LTVTELIVASARMGASAMAAQMAALHTDVLIIVASSS
jgi:hypothetical protein